MKDFLLRPFDERSMNETLAFSAFAHAVVFFASTLVAWLLPRYIEPFPSTRVEVVSEAELQQHLEVYRTTAKAAARQTTQAKQQEPPKEEQSAEQNKPVQNTVSERVAVESSKTTPKTQEKTQTATQEQSDAKEEEKNDSIDSLLTSLEKPSDEEATLDESLDEALAETEVAPSFLTSESILTAVELATFRRHITRCWSPPVGAPALENLVVDLLLTIDEQAYVIDALVMDRARMASDPFFRSAAEAALRTLSDKACSPLRLPLEKHALWKKTVLRFDPRSLFGS